MEGYEPAASALRPSRGKLTLKTLAGDVSINFNEHGLQYLKDLKKLISNGDFGGIRNEDVLWVCEGRLVRDDEELIQFAGRKGPRLCACIRSTSIEHEADIAFCSRENAFPTKLLKFSLATKVYQVKRDLQRLKAVPYRPTAQRLILSGRLVNDESILLGDYILAAVARRVGGFCRKGKSSRIVIYVSRQVDCEQRMEARILFHHSRTVLKLSVEIGSSANYLRSLLVHRYGMVHSGVPMPMVFMLSIVSCPAGDERSMSPSSPVWDESDHWVMFDGGRTFLDLGVSTSSAVAHIRVVTSLLPHSPFSVDGPFANRRSEACALDPVKAFASSEESTDSSYKTEARLRKLPGDGSYKSSASISMFKGMRRGFLLAGQAQRHKSARGNPYHQQRQSEGNRKQSNTNRPASP
jgi:hypothetical protein